MRDLFTEKRISPMLIAENVAPFADKQYLYEMKWDGERCVAYLDPKAGTELRNKRNVRMLPKMPELAEIEVKDHQTVNFGPITYTEPGD